MDFQQYVDIKSLQKDREIRATLYEAIRKYGLKPDFNPHLKDFCFLGEAALQSYTLYLRISGGHGCYNIRLAAEIFDDYEYIVDEHINKVSEVAPALALVEAKLYEYA